MSRRKSKNDRREEQKFPGRDPKVESGVNSQVGAESGACNQRDKLTAGKSGWNAEDVVLMGESIAGGGGAPGNKKDIVGR